MDCSTPGFTVHHQIPELAETHVHQVGDAIQPSHPPLSPSPPAPNLSQHQGLFQWVSSSNQVAKVLDEQREIDFNTITHNRLSSVLKKFTCNAGDPCTIPEWGRSAEEGIGYPFQYSWASLVAQLVKNLPAMQETWVRSLGWDPLQYSGLENSMDSIIITKSWTRLSDFHFHPQQGGAATAV